MQDKRWNDTVMHVMAYTGEAIKGSSANKEVAHSKTMKARNDTVMCGIYSRKRNDRRLAAAVTKCRWVAP